MSVHPWLSGNFAPVRSELDLAGLAVSGDLPDALCGTLYRVGPNPQFDPRDPFYHWFAGDGMVHALHIEHGRAAYRNRWMRTPKWQLEHDAGRALFGTFGNPLTSDPAVIGLPTGTANTSIIAHGGRLFALEESHRPFEFDASTLASLGYRSFGGALGRRFTAHPKADPASGELHFFAYSTDGPGSTGFQYGILDQQCRVRRQHAFDAPYASMVHDFAVTSAHVLFPIMPLTTSMERAVRGLPLFAWEDGREVCIGILPKGGDSAALRWLDTDACHVFHFMNAWESGRRITVLALEARMAPGMPHADGRPGDAASGAARLARWTIDLDRTSGAIERTVIDDAPAEFPAIDPRYAGRRNRYGWTVCHGDGQPRSGTDSLLYGTLACHDFRAGRRQHYTLPQGDVLSEPVFAPRSAGAPEGDGWILATAWRAAEERSDLLVFEARAIEAGPLAQVHLPCRIPFGFHGAWVAA